MTFSKITHFASLEVPQFECAEFVGTQVMEWANLHIQDEKNRARAGGVDSNQYQRIDC